MSTALFKALVVLLCMLMQPFSALCEPGTERNPGLSRAADTAAFLTYDQLAERYEIAKERYTAADGKPLSTFMVTAPDCMVGIRQDGMYKVVDKGIGEIAEYLTELASAITEASEGTIRFVSDPDRADILIKVNQRFISQGKYISGSKVVKGYASEVTIKAFMLSNQYHTCVVTRTNAPGRTVSLSNGGGGSFWMKPPKFRDTEEMNDLVRIMMSWYGYQRKNGSASSLVRSARQSLIDRNYLRGEAGAVFDDDMEAAVLQLQADYGLKETGVIDRPTLLAIYYNQETVKQNLADYPPETDEDESAA